jgi:hypothetical protein
MAILSRIPDGAGDAGSRSEALKYDENGKNPEVVGRRPIVGVNMLVGSVTARSYSKSDYWLTTEITEILEDTGDYVKFKTKNSIYEWRE